MTREQVLAILYEMAILIGGETRVRPLLTATLQKLLYHTSFPCGLLLLDPPPAPPGGGPVEARLELAIGDLELVRRAGGLVRLPAGLLHGGAALAERPDLLDALPGRAGRYRAFLRLPIEGRGVILLLGPEVPESPFPLERIFQPVLRNLAKALVLCERNEAWAAGLQRERARAEAAYQDLSSRSELILESVGEGICGVSPDGRVTFVNPAAERLLGASAAELAGRPFHDAVRHGREGRAEVPPGECAVLDAMRAGRTLRTDDDTFRRSDGTCFPVELVATPLRDGGRIAGAVVVFRDVTERRRAEKELRRLNRALQTLSLCNLSLIHAREEESLLHGVCSVLVEVGGYAMVWVGAAGTGNGAPLRPVARAGREEGYLGAFSLEPAACPESPFAAAVLTGQTQLEPDLYRAAGGPWLAEALRRGYASCLALPLRLEAGTFGALVLFADEPDATTRDELVLLEELAADLAFGIATLRTRTERDRALEQQARHLERLRHVTVDTIQALSAIIEMRDPYTAGHQRRVSQLAVAIGRELGLPEERVEGIRFGSLIHDIGKIYVPSDFLNRPGQLTELELAVIKTHPKAGWSILKDIDFPWPVARMIYQHHELLDGTGYPCGLSGGEIVLEARIIAVADALEAMVSHRPYRPSRGLEVALGEIERRRGTLYDDAVVGACLALFREGRFAFS